MVYLLVWSDGYDTVLESFVYECEQEAEAEASSRNMELERVYYKVVPFNVVKKGEG